MTLPVIDEAIVADLIAERGVHRTSWAAPHAYASEGGDCARRVGFRVAGVPETNPLEPSGIKTAWLGNVIHERIQTSLLARMPEARAEVRGQSEEYRISARADLLHPAPDGEGTVLREIKTKADYGYKLAVGGLRRAAPPEGPSYEDVIQAHISAVILGADQVGMVYVNRGDMAVHEFPLEPVDRDEALKEMKRLSLVVEWALEGKAPPRRYGGQTIADPTALKWPCGYCRWRDVCVEMEPGSERFPVLEASKEAEEVAA